MKILVLGVRGMPNVQGGVETHAEQLYERLSRMGCDIEVIVRTPFVPSEVRSVGAIRLKRIWSPRSPGLEALVHSVLGVFYALFARPDILHIHAIGPAIVAPLARAFGLRVVVTHHGPDYDRAKWKALGQWVLRRGEQFGMRFSNARIAISRVIVDLVLRKYHRESELIPNGVNPADIEGSASCLTRYGLDPGKYVLQVSRLVPEKRQLDLIHAFSRASLPGWKLVLAGGFDGSAYEREVRAAAEKSSVVLTGFVTGEPLRQLYSHAGLFVLPSSHEGLPIALLEALSYGLPVVASDIPANLEIALGDSSYFQLGNIDLLTARIVSAIACSGDPESRAARMEFVRSRYDWSLIAEQTLALYRKVLAPVSAPHAR
jgi:glycosyltransferase involved in cell wall biosynthesis